MKAEHPDLQNVNGWRRPAGACEARGSRSAANPVTADAGPELVESGPLSDRDVRAAVATAGSHTSASVGATFQSPSSPIGRPGASAP
jgi:hypothetical protein